MHKVNFSDFLNIQYSQTISISTKLHIAHHSFISYYECNLLETSGTHIREGRRYISIYILQGKPKYTTYASFKNTYGHLSRDCHNVGPGHPSECMSSLRPQFLGSKVRPHTLRLFTYPCIHRDQRFAQRDGLPSNTMTLKLRRFPSSHTKVCTWYSSILARGVTTNGPQSTRTGLW